MIDDGRLMKLSIPPIVDLVPCLVAELALIAMAPGEDQAIRGEHEDVRAASGHLTDRGALQALQRTRNAQKRRVLGNSNGTQHILRATECMKLASV